ncbi:MAG: hypothetical protein ACK4GK_15030 [Ferrovibrio sp.]
MIRRNYLFSKLNVPFFVEAKIYDATIVLRSWRVSADAKIDALTIHESKKLLEKAPKLFVLDADPFDFSLHKSRQYWIPAEALSDVIEKPIKKENLYLQPISQIAFEITPEIIGHGAWADYGLWIFNSKRDGTLEMPFNRYIESYNAKSHRQLIVGARNQVTLLMVCVPFASNNFDRCSFILKYNENYGCSHNMQDFLRMPKDSISIYDPPIEYLFGVKALLPSLRLAGPDVISAGQMANFTVEVFDKNVDELIADPSVRLYLESNAGYLTHRQVYTKGGVGHFSLIALGLEPGDKIKLKAGWRNYSGADEKIISVI